MGLKTEGKTRGSTSLILSTPAFTFLGFKWMDILKYSMSLGPGHCSHNAVQLYCVSSFLVVLIILIILLFLASKKIRVW